MEGYILTDIKSLLGIVYDDTSFDNELIIHINTVLSILTQMGVGPEEGYSISNSYNMWSDFLTDMSKLEMIKSFVYLKVKLIFDPPTGAVLEAYNNQIKELEWRIYISVNP